MKDTLEHLNQRLYETDISDYYIDELKYERLVILGSFDLSYYHDVEIVFEGVQYVCCPTYMESPKFRIADEAEVQKARERINQHVDLGEGNFVISIDEEGEEPGKHFIVADRVGYNFEKVLHYVNEDVLGE